MKEKQPALTDFEKTVIADFIASNWYEFWEHAVNHDASADEIYKKLGGIANE